MGRSVGVARDALAVAYSYNEELSEEYYDQFMFNDYLQILLDKLRTRYPSLDSEIEESNWHDSEGKIIASNGHCKVVVYTYFDLVSICLVPEDFDNCTGLDRPLSVAWCEQISAGFEELMGSLNRIGTFSNGEVVFSKI